MRNAKNELLEAIEENNIYSKIKCLKIYYYDSDFFLKDGSERKLFTLKINHNESDYEELLEKLDFEYDNDKFIKDDDCFFGGGYIYLDGTIWFEDGSWLDKENDDDMNDRWIHWTAPDIPTDLK